MSRDRALRFSWHQADGENGETVHRGAFGAQQLLNSIDGFVDMTPANTSHRWRCSGNFTLLHDDAVILSADIALPSFREKDLRLAKANVERMFMERLANIRAGINTVESGLLVVKQGSAAEPMRSTAKIFILRALVKFWREYGQAPKRQTLIDLVNELYVELDGKPRSVSYINKQIYHMCDHGLISDVDDSSLVEGDRDGYKRRALIPMRNEHGHLIRMERLEHDGQDSRICFFLVSSDLEYTD